MMLIFLIAEQKLQERIEEIRLRMMDLKLKEFINELNTAGMPFEEILAAINEVRMSVYDVVSDISSFVQTILI